MCKLYAVQTTMTSKYARRLIMDRTKEIMKTESDGFGIVLNTEGLTRTWQCGGSFSDSIGEDVLGGLTDKLQMATLMIHGRTSTSSNTTVAHSHPRETEMGPLIHNGVVVPKSKEGWLMEYDLDTDYLSELADRGELDKAAEYLDGYAGIMVIAKDGTLTVQNHGANLYMSITNGTVEFGTTLTLCPGGTRFELLKITSRDANIQTAPVPSMSGRMTKYDNLTNRGVASYEKKSKQLALVSDVKPNVVTEKKSKDQQKSGGTGNLVRTDAGESRKGRNWNEVGLNPKKKGRRSIGSGYTWFGDDISEDIQIPEHMIGRADDAEELAAAYQDFKRDA